MCGRMTQQTDPAEVARIFDAESRVEADGGTVEPRYNGPRTRNHSRPPYPSDAIIRVKSAS